MSRKKGSPGPSVGRHGLYTVTELAHYLNVSRLYIYRVVKHLGPDDGVYQLPSQGGTQMTRIDAEKFLHRHKEPATVSADREGAARVVKNILGDVEPLLHTFDDWVKGMERLYGELTDNRDDHTELDSGALSEGEQEPPPRKAAG